MTKIFALLLLFCLQVIYCRAQWYVEPVAGYQSALNNHKFGQVNSALQFSGVTGKSHEIIFQLQKSWPVASSSGDSAFSPNPAMPGYINAAKKIKPAAITMAIGNRFTVARIKNKSIFSLLLFAGIKFEKIEVTYNYDKKNYTILNPDKTQKTTGVYLSLGAEYMRVFNRTRFFAQLGVATSPIGKKIHYPSSFKYVVPLAINFGYSFRLSK